MASILNEPLEPPHPGGRKPVYPWDDWLDGQAWLIVQGEDFTSNVDSMRSLIRNKARARGLTVSVRRRPGGALALQAMTL